MEKNKINYKEYPAKLVNNNGYWYFSCDYGTLDIEDGAELMELLTKGDSDERGKRLFFN